ncbi:hypothetical protein JV173_03635 [Acholeplasma equirhinis]|uniref:hypothetical protein n=1 Tax=Acholeplasma equirhinis TaxID=555393 RepID=UPI00197ACF01|nr:hypothetical protein [Acholeplasma equirhinis]MBN3490601.1 hypothetical protein [Acholeplasma equirhinis]
MEYKMSDVVKITKLPRTTIQGYFPEKNNGSITKKGGGGPQWKFNDQELEELWFIKICISVGKTKNEIEKLRKLPDVEKKIELNNMLNMLQENINVVKLYVEARPIVMKNIVKETSLEDVSKIYTEITSKLIDQFDSFEDIFSNALDEKNLNDVFNFPKLIKDFSNALDFGYFDKKLTKMIKSSKVRKSLLENIIYNFDEITDDDKKHLMYKLNDYYVNLDYPEEDLQNHLNHIIEFSTHYSYISTEIQSEVNQIYLLLNQIGYSQKYIKELFSLYRDEFKKEADEMSKNLEWYLSKVFETYILNKIKIGEFEDE